MRGSLRGASIPIRSPPLPPPLSPPSPQPPPPLALAPWPFLRRNKQADRLRPGRLLDTVSKLLQEMGMNQAAGGAASGAAPGMLSRLGELKAELLEVLGDIGGDSPARS